MSTVNFNNIEENKSLVTKRKTIEPSVQILTIAEAEFKKNVNDKEYLALRLVNEDDQYLKPQIYVTTNSGWARVKELATSAGIVLGEETNETIVAKLLGKKAGFVINGSKEIATIDGENVVVTRGELPFSKFSFPVADLANWEGKFKIVDKTATESAPSTGIDLGVKEDPNDLPF